MGILFATEAERGGEKDEDSIVNWLLAFRSIMRSDYEKNRAT